MEVLFKSKERIVTDYFVCIDGERFDFFDVISALRCIDARHSSIVITDMDMVRVFKNHHIIEFEGSRRKGIGARFGSEGKKFLAMLEEKEEKIYKKEVKK